MIFILNRHSHALAMLAIYGGSASVVLSAIAYYFWS